MKTDVDQERISIAWQEPAMMQIGKAGISDSVIEEAKRLLKKHKYMKVRILRSAITKDSDKRALINQFCELCGAAFAGVRGNTAVIYKVKRRLST
jgi:RNA-binding protein